MADLAADLAPLPNAATTLTWYRHRASALQSLEVGEVFYGWLALRCCHHTEQMKCKGEEGEDERKTL